MVIGLRARTVGVALGVVALSGLLGGCEVKASFAAVCVGMGAGGPIVAEGFVGVDVEIPPTVAAGSTFTVRVDRMGGAPEVAPPDLGPETGVLAVTGGATPSGQFAVGPSYPDTLTFTATGAPGEMISLDAVNGTSTFLVPHEGVVTFDCTPSGGHVADIAITES